MTIIEVVGIGDELLNGRTVNGNATVISRHLRESGFTTSRHLCLPDEEEALKKGLMEALERADVVIATGGLGPTIDDRSRHAAAEIFHSPLSLNPELLEHLKNRFGDWIPTLDDQATIPNASVWFDNPLGTASGLLLQNESSLFLLPGVPREMEKLLVDHVIPKMKEMFPSEKKEYIFPIHFCGLMEQDADQSIRKIQEKYPEVQMGIYPSMMILSVEFKAWAKNESEAGSIVEAPMKMLRDEFSTFSFESDSGKIEEAVLNECVRQKITLSLAESCTGGAIASRLTSLSGASEFFLGSVVSYSNEMKSGVLGVSKESLTTHGAVSQEVAEEMANGALKVSGSDYSLSVTGVAGPSGGSEEKPVGTVWMAIGKKGSSPQSFLLRGKGTREMIIEQTTNLVLCRFLKMIQSTFSS